MRVSNWVSLSCSAFGPSDTTSGPTLSPANCANVFPMLFPVARSRLFRFEPSSMSLLSRTARVHSSSPQSVLPRCIPILPRICRRLERRCFSRHPKARILKGPRGGKGNSRASSFFSFPGRFGAFCSSFSSSEIRSLSSSLYDVVFGIGFSYLIESFV